MSFLFPILGGSCNGPYNRQRLNMRKQELEQNGTVHEKKDMYIIRAFPGCRGVPFD